VNSHGSLVVLNWVIIVRFVLFFLCHHESGSCMLHTMNCQVLSGLSIIGKSCNVIFDRIYTSLILNISSHIAFVYFDISHIMGDPSYSLTSHE